MIMAGKKRKHSILIVDDEKGILNAIRRQLQDTYNLFTADSGIGALKILNKNSVSVIIADQRMPEMTGVEFLEKTLSMVPDSIKILITAYADLNATIDAVNRGKIFYYLAKPWEPEELDLIVRRAIDQFELKQENTRLISELQEMNKFLNLENRVLKETLVSESDFSKIITNDPEMLNLFKMINKILNVNATVLLEGETGTGKELFARAIHYNSDRKDKLFVVQNCAALPDTLLESELFGHVKGAFTGAINHKKGLLELAHQGTIFLDEIGDTSPDFQVRLLRFLQEGEIRPLGSVKAKIIDVRVIAATNKILSEEVARGKFREDLFYRLSVFPLSLPPLRKRQKDVSLLTDYFIEKYSGQYEKKISGVSEGARKLLGSHHYPGNVRELENIIARAILLTDDNTLIEAESLLFSESNHLGKDMGLEPDNNDLKEKVAELEKEMILSAITRNNKNLSGAARQLNITRQGLYKKIKRYGL